jgi:hypothetical protein
VNAREDKFPAVNPKGKHKQHIRIHAGNLRLQSWPPPRKWGLGENEIQEKK